MHAVCGMTRDCPTSRMSRIDLRDLIAATTAPERQMVTIRMPALRLEPAIQFAITPVRATRGPGDVTLLAVICSFSMTICGALAWF